MLQTLIVRAPKLRMPRCRVLPSASILNCFHRIVKIVAMPVQLLVMLVVVVAVMATVRVVRGVMLMVGVAVMLMLMVVVVVIVLRMAGAMLGRRCAWRARGCIMPLGGLPCEHVDEVACHVHPGELSLAHSAKRLVGRR